MHAKHEGKLEGMPAREDMPDRGFNANGYQDQLSTPGQEAERAPSMVSG